MDDRPPDVRILRPSADQQITPLEEVPIEARADDDYGIERFELVYAVAGGAEHVVAVRPHHRNGYPEDRHEAPASRGSSTSSPATSSRITRARPISGVASGSTEATSDIFFLEVKPFNEEFIGGGESRGAGAADPQIESLIQAQKEIIASTWNVERRSQAARSSRRREGNRGGPGRAEGSRRSAADVANDAERAATPAPQQLVQPPWRSRGAAGDPAATAVGADGKGGRSVVRPSGRRKR